MATERKQVRLDIEAAIQGTGQLVNLAGEIEALGGDATELRAEAGRLNEQLERLQAQSTLIDTFERLTSSTEQAASTIATLRGDSDAAAAAQQILQNNLSATTQALQITRQSTADLVASTDRAATELKEESAALASLNQQLKGAEAATKGLNTVQTATAREVRSAESALSASERALASNQNSVQRLETQLRSARDSQKNLTDQVIAADQPSETLTQRHERATQRVELLSVQLGVARGKTTELTTAVQANAAAVQQAQSRYEEAEQATRDAGQSTDRLRQQVTEARAEYDRQRAALAASQQALRASAGAERDLERAVTADERALAKQSQTLEGLRGKLSAAEQAQETQTAELRRASEALDRAGVETNDLATAQARIRQSTVLASTAIGEQRQALEQQRDALRRTSDSANTAGERMDALGRRAKAAIAGFLTIAAARQLIQVADAAQLVESRLRLVTDSEQELASAQTGLLALAQRTRSAYEGTAELFVTIARSADSLGLSQTQLLGITETIQQSVKVSGASASSAQAALVQLGQGLASGTLRGEELNSILLQTPRLAQALADGLGVSTGKLRELGKDGQLTAERVIAAIESQSAAVRAEFEKLAPTVADNVTNAKTSFQQFVAELNQLSGSTSAVGQIIGGVGGIFESLAINLELARKEEEKQKIALFEVGSVAAESAERIRGLASAETEASAQTQQLNTDISALQAELQNLDGDLSKLSAENLAGLATRSRELFIAAQQDIANLRAEFPALANVSTEALAAVDSRFGDAQRRITETGQAVEQLRSEQLSRLGVDASAVLTGIDREAAALLQTFRSLLNDPQADPKLLQAAFDSLFKRLESPEELDALRQSLGQVRASGFDAAGGIEAIEAKLAEIPGTAEAAALALANVNQQQLDGALEIYRRIQEQRDKERQESDKTADHHAQNEAQKAESSEQSAERQERAAGGVAKAVADLVNGNRAVFAALSAEAEAAFDRMLERTARVNISVGQFLEEFAGGVRDLQAIQVEQTKQAEQQIARLNDVTTTGAATLQVAESIRDSFEFLDQETLSGLNAAIDSTRARMQALADESRATFNTLRDELDRLRGDEEKIDDRRRAEQRTELEANLQSASRSGADRETLDQIRDSIRLLDEIEREIANQRAAAARQDAQTARAASTPARTTATPPAATQAPVRRVEVTLNIGGSRIPVETSEANADALLDVLARAQAVAGL